MSDDTATPARLFDHAPWTRQAACHGLTTLFFSDSAHDLRQAKAVCATCPVIDQCRKAADDEAVRGGGVWAGTTANERRPAATRKRGGMTINHGTNGGAQAHYRLGVPMCDPCRQAQADDKAARRAARCAAAAAFRNAGGHNADWQDVA